uniref:hypothetical protein n=1 Tax=Thaumasiovibrio occultus TaxID=1891184 RepID=UPI000B35474F|nr:hypothetical protein [Thaumasiovibrio occultus]
MKAKPSGAPAAKDTRDSLLDTRVPGFTTLSGWLTPPHFPEEISGIWVYRAGGHVGVTVKAQDGGEIPFFFDSQLGRLCYGENEHADNAAFIQRGSAFEADVFAYLTAARQRLSTCSPDASEAGTTCAVTPSELEIFDRYFHQAKAFTAC